MNKPIWKSILVAIAILLSAIFFAWMSVMVWGMYFLSVIFAVLSVCSVILTIALCVRICFIVEANDWTDKQILDEIENKLRELKYK
jgi:hypothetical protein